MKPENCHQRSHALSYHPQLPFFYRESKQRQAKAANHSEVSPCPSSRGVILVSLSLRFMMFVLYFLNPSSMCVYVCACTHVHVCLHVPQMHYSLAGFHKFPRALKYTFYPKYHPHQKLTQNK